MDTYIFAELLKKKFTSFIFFFVERKQKRLLGLIKNPDKSTPLHPGALFISSNQFRKALFSLHKALNLVIELLWLTA